MTELAATQFCHLHTLQSVTYSLDQIFFISIQISPKCAWKENLLTPH